jgi:hypothetical protein
MYVDVENVVGAWYLTPKEVHASIFPNLLFANDGAHIEVTQG